MPSSLAQRGPPSTVDIDLVIKVLGDTFFSPFWSVLMCITLYAQLKRLDHPAVVVYSVWTGVLCFIGLWRHVDRIYAGQGTWLLAPPKLDWEDQIVLITGGDGIGALLAETLAHRNVTVVIMTKFPPENDSDNPNVHVYICDVSDYDVVSKTADRVRAEVGDPTIIVNNAGIVKGKLLLDLTKEDIIDTFGANTLAQFWILKAFLPALVRRGTGHIVTMSSILGLIGAAQMTDYCASKAALVSLHQTLRFELDNRYLTPAVQTTLVLPSFTLTTLFAKTLLPSSRLFNFFAPPVLPHNVVKAIIDTLDAQESRVIRLPWYSNVARVMGVGLGILPKWMSDFIQWASGADFSMVDYGPKPDAGERLRAERQAAQGDPERKDM